MAKSKRSTPAVKKKSPEHRVGTVTNMIARAEFSKSEYSRDKGVSIPRAAFARVVRHTIINREGDYVEKAILRISPKAIMALQIFAEQSVGDHINKAAYIAEAIGNTQTLMVKHFDAAERAFHVSGGAKMDTLEQKK